MRDTNLRLVRAIAFCSFVCLLTGANLTFGQKPSRQGSQKSCRAGKLSFVCPEGFKSVSTESEQNFALLFHKKQKLGLFVAMPERDFDERKVASDATKTALAKFYPEESQAWRWKPVNYSDTVSKYEVGGGMVEAFNGDLLVVIKYRRVKVNDKEIFVGYVANIIRGKEAQDSFEGAGYTDSLAGCNAAVEVIYSFTGEKINEEDPPCVFVTSRPVG
jgi:hypothetical protein